MDSVAVVGDWYTQAHPLVFTWTRWRDVWNARILSTGNPVPRPAWREELGGEQRDPSGRPQCAQRPDVHRQIHAGAFVIVFRGCIGE